jgi:hypothetical protein
MDSFDANKVLPQNIVIKGAENHLYRIGLNLVSNGRQKRSNFYNPLVIFSVQIVTVTKSIVSLLTPEENERLLKIIGDFAHFIGVKTQFDVDVIITNILALTSQLIYYYIYKSGIKQTYLKVFDMMSGLISPKSIGLTNKVEIYKLIKESKILFSFCEWNNKIIPLMVFTINLLLFILNYSLLDLMIFGIPHSILYALCVHYNCCIIFLPLVYFYLICGYIKIKIKEQNDSSQKRLLSEKSLTVRKSYDRFML